MNVLETIARHRLIAPGGVVGVAASGGSDSMAVLHLLNRHAKELKITVKCVNVEHGIRGENSVADSAFVHRCCKEWGIEFLGFSADVLKLAAESGRSLEQEAREVRYTIFRQLLDSGTVDRVAVCHNREDNAESILMHLFRGSGLQGCRGMQYDNGEGIIRPLLDTKRAEVLRYLEQERVDFREDETNSDPSYTRNFLRLRVMPLLRERWPKAEENLIRFAKGAAEDEDYLSGAAEKRLLAGNGEYSVPVSLSKIPSLFKRAVKRAAAELGRDRDVEAAHLESVLKLACSGLNGARLDLGGGVAAYRDYDRITLERAAGLEKDPREVPFSLGTTRFCGRVIDCASESGIDLSRQGHLVAASAVRGAVWRTSREGDMIRPFGAEYEKKLSEYLSEKKIPERRRDTLPLLANAGRVLLVLGTDISEDARARQEETIRITHHKE